MHYTYGSLGGVELLQLFHEQTNSKGDYLQKIFCIMEIGHINLVFLVGEPSCNGRKDVSTPNLEYPPQDVQVPVPLPRNWDQPCKFFRVLELNVPHPRKGLFIAIYHCKTTHCVLNMLCVQFSQCCEHVI